MFEIKALRIMQENCGIQQDVFATTDHLLPLTSTGRVEELLDPEERSRLKNRLDAFAAEYKSSLHAAKVIDSLNFVEIGRRWTLIPKSEERTNSWLFGDAETGFVDWLNSSSTMYWIDGKVRLP